MEAKLVIDKRARRVAFALDSQLKAKARDAGSNDPGWIEGYAYVWDGNDTDYEVIQRGAFARSISAAIPARKVKLMMMHYRDGGDACECIGTVTEAKEDDVGLWIHADLSAVQSAQDMRTKILEGHVEGLSVGYLPVQWQISTVEGNQTIFHQEVKLVEVTTTVRPANEEAGITSAKSSDSPTAPPITGKSAPDSSVKAPAVTAPISLPPDLARMKREHAIRRATLASLPE